jgi:hypothetical protein
MHVQEVQGVNHNGALYQCGDNPAAQQTKVVPRVPAAPMQIICAPFAQPMSTQAGSGTATSEDKC